MSGLHEGAPDPLAALRASDRRPKSQVLRERLLSADLLRQGPAVLAATTGRLAIAALVVALSIGVGWRLFTESEPPVEASLPLASGAPPTTVVEPNFEVSPLDTSEPASVESQAPAEVVVHVAGAVVRPGIIEGTGEWRIDDAVTAAGGAAASADLDRVNLAAPILDGQRIFVPFVDEEVPVVIEPESASGEGQAVNAPVNLNTSDALALQSLPGVGPATAAAIVAHRDDFGAFGTVDALVSVPGIGPATLEALRDYVRV